jgi:hypothetical protein
MESVSSGTYLSNGGLLYLDLMKKILTRVVAPDLLFAEGHEYSRGWRRWVRKALDPALARFGYCLARPVEFDLSRRTGGEDWPAGAETMIGIKRLDNISYCLQSILKDGVPGDVIETGVWRGGACIFMRAILAAAGDTTRKVWVADSFEGLPKATAAVDLSNEVSRTGSAATYLKVSLDEVQANFEKYGLLDEQVQFLKGWFKDTLPAAPIQQLSLIRLDGDMYESTMDAISNLYPKLSRGGFLIVDDYGTWPTCKMAIDEYRARFKIIEPIVEIDKGGVFWQRR